MATWTVVSGTSVAGSGVSTADINTIKAGLIAAGEDWEKYFHSSNATIRIRLEIEDTTTGTATGGSTSAAIVGTVGEQTIVWSNAAAKLDDGEDINGSAAEIVVTIDPDYLAEDIWLDPTPETRSGDVPGALVDAQSVFLHEIGHALGFIGYTEWDATSPETGDFLYTFDQLIEFPGGKPYFTGTRAVAVYGADVPLTSGNLFHVGNEEPLAGSDLIPELMNGVVSTVGVHDYISPLDTAMLADTGLRLRVPRVIADTIYGYERVNDEINLLAGNDTYHGLSGNDDVLGGSGNDKLYGENGLDVLTGGTGHDSLQGGGGNDRLVGGGGNDLLTGGIGKDTLIGSTGADVFIFNASLTASNSDKVSGFVSADDVIHLDNDVFTLLGSAAGAFLGAARFKANADGTATDSSDRIVYNTTSGALLYDPDGNGPQSATEFAVLPGAPDLVAGDFFVVD